MPRITIAAVAATIAVAIAGCGASSKATYPANVQTNFLNACEESGTVSTCDCSLSYIEGHVTLAKFQVANANIDSGGSLPSWGYDALSHCANN